MEIEAHSMDHLVLLLALFFCVSMFLEAEKLQKVSYKVDLPGRVGHGLSLGP